MRQFKMIWVGLLCCGMVPAAHAGFEVPDEDFSRAMSTDSERSWDLTLRASMGSNDNVQLVPTVTTYPVNGARRASYYALQADGSVRFYRSADVIAGFSLSASELRNENKLQAPPPLQWNFNEYDFSVLNPGLFVTYLFNAGSMPASITGSYDYREEHGAPTLHALGLKSNNLRLSGSLHPSERVQVNASLTRGTDRFRVVFPDPMLDDRNGSRWAADFSVRAWSEDGLNNVTAGLGHLSNNANGSNFDYQGFNGKLRVETGVLQPVWLAAEIDYGGYSYAGFQAMQPWKAAYITAPGRTSQRIASTRLQMIWPVTQHWSVDVFYTHDSYQANQPQFTASANVIGSGLSYAF